MATNHYFNNYGNKYTEQRLVEDLVVESIKIMGTDCFYLPNDNDTARDLIYGEDPLKTFTTAYPIELYPSNVMEYGGDKEFFSKFGLEIRNTMTVILSHRTFNQRVNNGTTLTRPREGDLIFIPPLRGKGELYEIKFVNSTKDMSMFGRKISFFYEMELEKFKYSQELIATGVPDIDIIQSVEPTTTRYIVAGETHEYIINEVVFQSPDSTYANAIATGVVSAYDSIAHTMDISDDSGTFVIGNSIIGLNSNAVSTIVSTDNYLESEAHADYDNKQLNTEASSIIDFSETNPFGQI